MHQFIRYTNKRSVNLGHLFEIGFSERTRVSGAEEYWYLILYEGVRKKSAVMMFCVREQSREGAENLFLKIMESSERVIDIREDILSAEEEYELLHQSMENVGAELEKAGLKIMTN